MVEQREDAKVQEVNGRVGAEAHDEDGGREQMHKTSKQRRAGRKE